VTRPLLLHQCGPMDLTLGPLHMEHSPGETHRESAEIHGFSSWRAVHGTQREYQREGVC